MSPIITQPGSPAHVHPDEAARKRRDRLARATAGQAEAALAYLSVIDPLMFEIAMDAADLTAGEAPGRKRRWTRSRSRCAAGAAAWSGSSSTAAWSGGTSAATGPRPAPRRSTTPGHPAEVTWRLPDEDPEEP